MRSLNLGLMALMVFALIPAVSTLGQDAGRTKNIVKLPIKSGSEAVGTKIFHWKDKKREELWTSDPDDIRELMVQVFYPAKKSESTKAPYIFGRKILAGSIKKYWGGELPKVSHDVFLDAPISEARGKYPVVVMSHGMNSSRFLYTALSQDLASHGFVVVSIDHTFWGPGVVFPNDKVVRYEDGMVARDKLTSDEIDRMMVAGISVMAADQMFVAAKLEELNHSPGIFRNRLDMTKVGSMGHSMGGMAATSTCLKYTIFKACLSLDGTNYFLPKMPNPSSKPFALLLNSQWGRKTPPKISTSYLEAWKNPEVAIVTGSKHNFFSDIPLIEPPKPNKDFRDPRAVFDVVRTSALGFFRRHLLNKKGETKSSVGLEPVDLRKQKPA